MEKIIQKKDNFKLKLTFGELSEINNEKYFKTPDNRNKKIIR